MEAQLEIIPNDSASFQADNNGNVLPIELTNATGTYPQLQTLNEHCLLEIFSHLSPLDLCSLAETCTLFNQLSDCVFPKEFQIDVKPEIGRYTFKSKTHFLYYESSRDIRIILKRFGSHLCTLKVSRNDLIVTDSVAKYCDAGKLKTMVIRRGGRSIVGNLNSKSQLIFKHLLTLIIDDQPGGPQPVPLNCDSLTELKISRTSWFIIQEILKNTFPKLERFALIDSPAINDFIEFIPRHKGMRSLYFRMEQHRWFDDKFMHAVGGNCKELEELTIISNEFDERTPLMDLSALHCLTKLKVLDIDCCYKSNIQLVSLLKALQSLEVVILSFIEVTVELVDALSQMQNLRQLQFNSFLLNHKPWKMLPQLTTLYLDDANGQLDGNDVLDMVSNLTNLDELGIIDRYDTSALVENMFCEIGKIVDRRPTTDALTLTTRLSENFLKNCNENQNLKLKNWI